MRQPAAIKKAAILLLTSNRGLAGAFNANLLKEARNLLARLTEQGVEQEIHDVGKKGLGYFRYIGREVASSRTDITGESTRANAAELVDGLIERYASGDIDAVYVIYSKFNSALST